MSLATALDRPWLRSARRVWSANFVGALTALVFVKLGLVGYNLISPYTRGYDSFWKMVGKFIIFVGSDVFGAAVFALLLTILCLPLSWRALERAALIVSLPFQAAHAVLSAASMVCVIYIGGPLNKTLLDLGFAADHVGDEEAGLGVLNSIDDYLNTTTVTILVAAALLAMAMTLLAPLFLARLRRVWAKRLAIAGAISAAFTMVLLPFLMSGEIGGIRIYTYGLEKSPVVDLSWSYIRTLKGRLAVDRGLIADEFRFDWRGAKSASEPPPLARAVPRRTNLLVVAMESVGAPYLEGDDDPMPFFRQLGQRPGAHRFNNNYSTWSLTSKAFFSVFCSELPYPTYKAESLVNPAIPCVTLSEVLHDQGYYTVFFTGQDLAYDRQRRFYRHRKFDQVLDRRTIPGIEGAWKGSWGVDDRFTVDKVLELARENRDRPFFIHYGMSAGHHPFNCCKEHVDNPIEDRVERYYRALGFVDDRLRDLIGGLEQSGLLDDTLVVIYSDHGDGHGRYVGRNAWQPVIKVPLMILGPQLGGEAGESDLVTSLVDMAPTILGLLGIDVPCTMKGRNLIVDGEHRVALFGGRPPKWQLGVADGRWKFLWEDQSLEMLFDLERDPGEYQNLAEQHPDKVERYRRKIEEWSAFSVNLIENYAEIAERAGCDPADTSTGRRGKTGQGR
jgi:arylsulfatase A-like enzyme